MPQRGVFYVTLRTTYPPTTQITALSHRGTLEIRAEAQTNTRDLFVVTFRGYKLANKDGFFGTSDPFLVISR